MKINEARSKLKNAENTLPCIQHLKPGKTKYVVELDGKEIINKIQDNGLPLWVRSSTQRFLSCCQYCFLSGR